MLQRYTFFCILANFFVLLHPNSVYIPFHQAIMWIILALLSALFLGCYDVAKKQSLMHFGVIQVLTLSVCLSSLLLLPMLLISRWNPEWLVNTIFYVPQVDWRAHFFIFLKSCLVLSSWVCAYIALKHLPLSTVAPMQATRPMWTLIGALLIFGERLTPHQWIGVAFALGSLLLFAISPSRPNTPPASKRSLLPSTFSLLSKYYMLLFAAILLGSASGLYDKYMMRHYDHNAVQVYYTFYQAALMLIVYLSSRLFAFSPFRLNIPQSSKRSLLPTTYYLLPILAISVFLVLSDVVYLLALTYPDSLIAVVATIRRAGTIIPFLYGILVLKEPDPWRKALCTIGILIGLLFLTLG